MSALRRYGVTVLALAHAHAAAADEAVAACVLELPPGDPPEWVQLLPAGAVEARDGRRWRLDDAPAVVAASLRRAGGTDLVFDYGHQTDHARENGQPAPAAGWIRALEARAGAVWGRVEWTGRARAMLRAREYRYVSPTFRHTRAGVVTEVLRAALTNNPALDLPALADERAGGDAPGAPGGTMHEQLQRILAKLGLEADAAPGAAEADALLARIDAPPDPSERRAVAAALGLPETASAAEVLAAARVAGSAPAAAPDPPPPDPTAHVPRAEFDRVAASLTALQTARAEEQATAAVDAAVAAGKLAPAQRDWGLAAARQDLAAFRSYADSAPAIVAPAAPAAVPPGADPAAALTDEERAVCRALGVTEERFRASRAADIARAEGVA